MRDRGYRRGLRQFIFLGCAVLWCGALCAPWPAVAASRCEICQADLSKESFLVEDTVRQVKKQVCESCSKSNVRCSACNLAVNLQTMLKLEDGRILCELDAPGAILAEGE